jgi:polysaccharide biosynthesis/export protein
MNHLRKETRMCSRLALWQRGRVGRLRDADARGVVAARSATVGKESFTMIGRRLLWTLPVFAVTACSGPGSSLPPLPDATATAYRLGPDDQVRVTVFNDPRLTGDFRVSDAGTIALPLVGAVQAAGRTTSEVERAIEQEMKTKSLFRDPSVAVQVTGYRPIFVLGMAERPGQFPYQPGMTVLTAVAVAGGFNYRAIRDYVSLTRIGPEGRPVEYRAGREALVQPGDVLNIFERRF